MTEKELQEYIRNNFPVENGMHEWKEMKNLKNCFNGHQGEDVMSYVSAISNMEGGELVIGVEDKTLNIVGTDYSNLSFNGELANTRSATLKILENCTHLSSEGLSIEEFITDDTHKKVWVIHIPKHLPRQAVIAHKKAWQRVEDSLIEMRKERMDAILSEPIIGEDWSAQIIPDATINDLDPKAIRFARDKYKELYPQRVNEVEQWDDITFLNKAHITRRGKITNAAVILLGK